MLNGAAPGLLPPFMISVFLVSIRMAAVFLMTPILYGIMLPTTVRVLLVVGLAVALAAGLAQGGGGQPSASSLHGAGLALAALWELALGATLALGILLAFAAFSMAGRLLDVQIGFGMAQVLDPVTRRQVPILNAVFDQLAIVIFFLLNGHHALLRGLAYSLERFPPGQPWPLPAMLPAVLQQVSGLFTLGFALAAPVVFCILLVEVALGVVSRSLPQMNMFAMGVPVKVVVGLAALALWQSGIGAVMSRVYAAIYSGWGQLFQSAQGA